MIIHESTLNIKLAAVPTLWSISPLPPPPPPPEDHSVGERKSSSLHMHACMHACMYVSVEGGGWQAVCACNCVPLCASHCNIMRACTTALLSGPCNAWLMIDGRMIVDCDELQW